MGIVSIKWPYDDAEQYEGLMADIRSAIRLLETMGWITVLHRRHRL